ncbi:MAG: class I SAM-dependent methyltransferase [Candidatus Theseobacter exili]|nr:class I SAM-dependent methyltransferase [Candidatus Theseobacter exili]
MEDIRKTIGAYWSKKTSNSQLKLRFWKSGPILKHINKIVCGDDVPGVSQGLIELVRSRARFQIPFNKGISVGGGSGHKEMNLIRQGVVNTFDLYEYSEARIAQGIEMAQKQSLEDRINFIHGDAFELIPPQEKYDFCALEPFTSPYA